jgi:hypothetical protein
MTSYKLYSLDHALKIAGPAQVVEALNDTEAAEIALGFLENDSGELWDGWRLVARLPDSTQSDAAYSGSTVDPVLRLQRPPG